MKKEILTAFCSLSVVLNVSAQTTIKGIVKSYTTNKTIVAAKVSLSTGNISTATEINGTFLLENVPDGKNYLVIEKEGFERLNYPINIKGKSIDFDEVFMYDEEFLPNSSTIGIITITDEELNEDTSVADNISGLLQSSKGVFLRTAAFDWSPSFYKLRGLGSENAQILINGISMNKFFNGRPQWSNWGGLNHVTRNQDFSPYLNPSSYAFGGALGTTQINTRASGYAPGNKIAYASSNRSYVHRLMATHASGVLKNKWSYVLSASGRYANQGFVNGTNYKSYSFFAAIEKELNKKHSINLTTIYAVNNRGKSAANTEEVYDLKGIQYNPYWGYQNGKIRNSRTRKIEEPIVMLNHYWNVSKKTTIETALSYQFGEITNSRLHYGGAYTIDGVTDEQGNPVIHHLSALNPDPTYYQKLPSYALSKDLNAYAYQEEFKNNGQINWQQLYEANIASDNNAAYILYDDVNKNQTISFNSLASSELNSHLLLNASVGYVKQESENFARVKDLLGANSFLDIDTFSDDFIEKQNNLLNPLFKAKEGDKIKYHYNLNTTLLKSYVQLQAKYKKIDAYVAANIEAVSHQREGLFKNGRYPDTSLGKSEKLQQINFSGKGGITYKINGRNFIAFNTAYINKAPYQQNIFFNARENNELVRNITYERQLMADASYVLRNQKLQTKLTTYYTFIKDAAEVSFFYADGISFLQEMLTGINKQHVGVELGTSLEITSGITIKAAANIGQYVYANNPYLYIASDDFDVTIKEVGTSYLKNYKLSTGPQEAYSLGIEYSDPNYWWFSATTNLFRYIYVDIAPLARTQAFYYENYATEEESLITDYDSSTAKELLRQERFDDYVVVNLVGGKSWRIKDGKFISLFASIGNVLNKEYKSGGYEQGRLTNYNSLLEDNALDKRIFGNKYWYGRGSTYFLNINYKF